MPASQGKAVERKAASKELQETKSVPHRAGLWGLYLGRCRPQLSLAKSRLVVASRWKDNQTSKHRLSIEKDRDR
jgi:hypothetical protein